MTPLHSNSSHTYIVIHYLIAHRDAILLVRKVISPGGLCCSVGSGPENDPFKKRVVAVYQMCFAGVEYVIRSVDPKDSEK